MRLFEIPDKLEQILAAGINYETGEIPDETMAAIEELEGERDKKLLALAAYIKGLLAEAAAVKAEADKLKLRAEIHKRQAARLREYLADSYPKDAPKLSDARSVIAWKKNPRRVELDAMVELPREVCRHVPESWEPDKKEIAARLKAGDEIEGAQLVHSQRLEIK